MARVGGDPAEARSILVTTEERRARSTFKAVMEDYIAYLPSRPRNLNIGHDTAFLRRNFLNADSNPWVDRPICLVTDADIASLVKAIRSRAPTQAHHALTHLKTFFRWAMNPDIRNEIGLESNPAANVTHRGLALKIKDRTRVFEQEEVASYLAACKAIPYPYGHCLRVLIELGQRIGATRQMRWSELNFTRKIWSFTSKGEKHDLPLSDRVVQLLTVLRNDLPPDHGDFVFSTTNGEFPIDGFSRLKLPKGSIKDSTQRREKQGEFERQMLAALSALWPGQTLDDWVWHDVRRTVRTHLEPITGNTAAAEAAIGHGPKGIVRVYNLYKYRAEIRRAFNAWSELLHKVESGTCTLADWEHDAESCEGVTRW